mgnify:FL=1
MTVFTTKVVTGGSAWKPTYEVMQEISPPVCVPCMQREREKIFREVRSISLHIVTVVSNLTAGSNLFKTSHLLGRFMFLFSTFQPTSLFILLAAY